MAQWGGAPPPHWNQSIRRGDQSLRAATGVRAGGEVVRLVRLGSVHAHTESALARLRSGLAHSARDRGLRRFVARLRRFLNPPTRCCCMARTPSSAQSADPYLGRRSYAWLTL